MKRCRLILAALLARLQLPGWLLVGLILAITTFSLWGLQWVPFHPDESTQLFMSYDFDQLWRCPICMAWSPEEEGSPYQQYRKLDAPLTRYLLGAARRIASIPALPADWDWAKTWQQNQTAGAVPDEQLLLIGRIAMTLLLPCSLFLIYRVSREINNELMGLYAALLLGSNALVLLHDRRAMAEGALTLGVIFAVWCFLHGDRKPWLAGFGLALAFNAKQSTLGLLPAGLLAVCWAPYRSQDHLRRSALASLQYLGVFALVTLALNPFYWRNPFNAAQVAWQARQELTERQKADILRLAPQQALHTTGERTVALLAHLYFTQPIFAEYSNYAQETANDVQRYLATPGHRLMRGMAGGGVMLALTLAGFALSLSQLTRVDSTARRKWMIVQAATICQGAFLVYILPAAWQRYVLPVVPLVCIWIAYALEQLTFRKKSLPQVLA